MNNFLYIYVCKGIFFFYGVIKIQNWKYMCIYKKKNFKLFYNYYEDR